MLDELQMKLVEHVFKSMKDMLFADGGVPQAYILSKQGDAVVFPLPPGVPLGSSIMMELATQLCEVEEAELVIFISEVWNVKRDPKPDQIKELTDENWQDVARSHLDGGTPSNQPDKSESLMMLVLEISTKKLHMKMGKIQRDTEGGPYVMDDEWLPSADIGQLRTTAFPSKILS